jgi:hypothetical protein
MASVALSAVTLVGTGCGPKGTTFQVVDFRDAGVEKDYLQDFGECFYRVDGQGHVELVAREISESGEGPATVQVIHVRTFLELDPSRTGSDATMINATVSYLITTGPIGASFEGSGYVFYRRRMGDILTGELELSSLKPTRRLGEADRLFDRAELSGTFRAVRDQSRVVSIVNDMRRRFGPMPSYERPVVEPEM